MTAGDGSGSRRRLYKPLLFVCTGCALLALVFALPVDRVAVLIVVGVCAGLLLIERTVGDWLIDFAGGRLASLLLAALLAISGWYWLGTTNGRVATTRFLSGGEVRPFLVEPVVTPVAVPHSASVLSVPERPPGPSSSSLSSAAPASASSIRTVDPLAGAGGGTRSHQTAAPSSGRVATAVSLRVSPDTTPVGLPVRLVAEVRPARPGVAEGTLVFVVDGKSVAAMQVSTGRAEAAVSDLPPGTHAVRARYLGSDRFQPSISDTVGVSVTDVPR